MKVKLICLLILFIPAAASIADEIHLPPGTCFTVPAGTNICADTVTIDSNACLIANDSTVLCQGIVIRGAGQIIIAVENISNEVPQHFRLLQNYPNPFNPLTRIRFDIPHANLNVKLLIFDAAGKEIAVLVNTALRAGTYEVTWDALNYSSGVYYYKLTAADFTETRKMVLIK